MFVFILFISILLGVTPLWAQEKILVKSSDPDVTVKVDGRILFGAFISEVDGAYPRRTLDIPDGKLRFTFNVGPHIVLVNRFSTNRAASTSLDYFYADIKNWYGLLPDHTIRIGKMKYDFGVEIWTDNPVETILINNSVGIAQGYDEGIHFMGPILPPKVLTYSLALFNGSSGVSNSAPHLSVVGKVATNPIEPLYLSLSLYNNGNLGPGSSDLRIGGLSDTPVAGQSWSRTAWQVDARWNYGPDGIWSAVGKIPEVPFMAALSYGAFTDEPDSGKTRKGTALMVEGVFNIIQELYIAGRFSDIKLDEVKARLAGSPVDVSEYQRISAGLGFRLHKLAVLKLEATSNSVKDYLADKPKLNQIALGLAMKF